MTNDPDDEAAIIELINRNRIAMWTQDFAAYSECFVHGPYLERWNASTNIGGIFIRQGWDDISARVKRQFADKSMYAPRLAHDTRVENLQLRIGGDMAWGTYEQHYPDAYPYGTNAPTLTNEARVFEKQDGVWRIAFLVFFAHNTSGLNDGTLLRLGPEGAVLWQTAKAKALLEEADDFVVRAGRLRMRDTRADQKLQAAIRWAVSLDTQLVPGRGALPIVVDRGDGLSPTVYWVISESGMILFSVGEAGMNRQRLAAAAVIFGLSAGQAEVAGYIADGLSLPEIAAKMAITTNTARTHLNRIYEKVGVRTQPALVRVLLSTAPPL